ncbi:hypothetical protein [Polyangium mundeleinium]|uniref:Lipoprotein n=1 Tax=Polyangium mundeleinium TaxID=2995306 RepID=A0ABT5EXX8_9BACT|nr:hypothetical protein [Polyangium mundeleinium]MDC0746678.1 hypothetical protein [Polyangium mundeleinium]
MQEVKVQLIGFSLGVVLLPLATACSSEPQVDAASASGGSAPSCCAEGQKVGDVCGVDQRGVCRGTPLECHEWCVENGACVIKRVEGPECRSSCSGEACPPQ